MFVYSQALSLVKNRGGLREKTFLSRKGLETIFMSRGRTTKKKNTSDVSLNHDSEVSDVECIIAHVPYPDTADPLPLDPPTLLKEVEMSDSLSPSLYNKVVLFLRNLVHSSDGTVSSSKGTKGKSSTVPDIVVKSSTLPMHRIDDSLTTRNVCCWWCTFPFSNVPVHLPHWVIDGVYQVTGHFCSYNCALAYNVALKDNNVAQRSNLLFILYRSCFTIREPSLFIPAPPRELLSRFGGWMEIEEFREHSLVVEHDVRLLLPPMQSVHYSIESQKRPSSSSTYPRTNVYVPLDHNSVMKARETLKLKRNQPKKTNYVSLEETMGIVKRPREVV